MTYYKRRRNKYAFTLSELAVLLIFLIVTGAIVTREALNNIQKKADIQKVQSTYDLLEKSAMAWQSENNCTDDIKLCVRQARTQGIPNKEIFNGIAKYLPVMRASVDVNAKGREVNAQKFDEIDWLPEETKMFDGGIQTNSSVGVSKYFDRKVKDLSYYELRDGVTIMVNLSNYNSNSGYGFFDINGKEGKNKIGIDVFPFSLGADINRKNPLYESAANKFNPYYSSLSKKNYSICNINHNTCTNEKLVTNPTFYVLKWDKLPK